MLQTVSRDVLHHQSRFYREPVVHKVVVPTTVCVKNPVTGIEEEQIVNTFKEEAFIDEHLRASDFNLEVQIRSGVDLKDCGRFFSPSTPEEYVDVINNVSSYLSAAQAKLEQPVESPSNVVPSKTKLEQPVESPSNVEPSKTE